MSTRDRILDAAAQVMRSHGLAKATTKEIAKAAGFSEAALYKHFRDKTDMFLAVLEERMPSGLATLMAGLQKRVGEDPVEDVLVEFAHAAIAFYGQTFPIAASLFSDPHLLTAHRDVVHDRGKGPRHVGDLLTAYLEAEQRGGRISAEADPRATADLLLGACLQHGFLSNFDQRYDDEPTRRKLAETWVRTLLEGSGASRARVEPRP
ncbi:TetR/AcrR family transcriptional regulator [Amycolatopsis magusensis]|uniref:AcrR family transcriptional regulator n=1 Tax=Amycolatopsis magusensis TaxID=882444 RepID=A0ABS4PJR0_9PSEU|nr:TetR/AcrR family transcriptional regulator [Amycolatopsis magusensis]MBP2178871.1 AcrR family transcriptional regulator [Amycolatopsis magusensis]MDI5975306.1 helix-turn-helix domain-containing protein [Amycolatopsis magusensis]